MRTRKLVRTLAATVAGAVLLTGCGGADFDVYELPLPGGTDVGDDPITVTVAFRDVLDLVPKSTVKVNDVNVGQVSDVRLDGFSAEVDLVLRNDVELPDNAVAEIRQTSLLGEKFVQLAAPATGADGTLDDGETIPLSRTGRNPEVEEVLGALSLVLNGGGVAQLNTITKELNKTLEGREDTTRSLLREVDSFVGQLDANKVQIVGAIESLNDLSLAVREQQPSIDLALEELPSALDSIDRQRDDLVRMLTALDQLGDVGVGVIRRSKAVTIETLQQLQPVLTQLANSGDNVVDAFNVFLTYPFVDEVVGRDPQVARNLHMGDFTNLSIQLDVDLGDLPEIPGLPCETVGNEAEQLDALGAALDQILSQSPAPRLRQALRQALRLLDAEDLCGTLDDVIQECIAPQAAGIGLPEACLGLLEDVCNQVRDASGIDLPFCTAAGGLVPLEELQELIDGITGGLTGGGTDGGGGDGGGVIPLPGGNPLDGVTGGGRSGGRNGGGGGGGGGNGGPLGGILGGNRAAFGPTRDAPPAATSGPTLGQLTQTFDPALTTLLVPGMVTR